MNFAALLALLACGPTEVTPRQTVAPVPQRRSVPDVWATNHPSSWLATRLGDGVFQVNRIVSEGTEADAPPTPDQIARLAEADLIVANGAGLETWMATAALPEDRVVNTAQNLDLIQQPEVTHSHGPGGDHTHAAVAPQTWADPDLYFAQGRATHAALVILDPTRRDIYDTNLRKLERDLKSLSMRYQGVLSPYRDRSFGTHGSSFTYLARRYQFQLHELDLEPAVLPTEEEVAAFRRWSEAQEAPVMLWEQDPSSDVLAALGPDVAHLTIDPLQGPPGDGDYDYLSTASSNIDRFQSLSSD